MSSQIPAWVSYHAPGISYHTHMLHGWQYLACTNVKSFQLTQGPARDIKPGD